MASKRTTRTINNKPKDAKPVAVATNDDPGAKADKTPSKLDLMTSLLNRTGGASIDELRAVTGWQAHSVRGALAGALRKKGLVVTSSRTDGVRRYALGA